MIPQVIDKSSRDKGIIQTAPRLWPARAWLGLASMLLFEILLVATRNDWVGRFFTPIQWTGLILFLDGWKWKRTGRSFLGNRPREFAILCLISIPSWAIFEGYNVVLQNWRYLSLPENLWIRYAGYAWAFATISPGMFLIYETLDDLLPGSDIRDRPRLPTPVFVAFVTFGAACLILPFIVPSPSMTPLVWMGFAFFLDPINGRMGDRSILAEFFTGRFRAMPIFFLSGLIAGLLWEFWNYWALAKWEYHVPWLGHIKVFEMPVLGFLGFMPFIVESYAIYRFVRRLIPLREEDPYLA